MLLGLLALVAGSMQLSLVGMPDPRDVSGETEGHKALIGAFWLVAGLGVLSAVA
jgi:hypothetical protein